MGTDTKIMVLLIAEVLNYIGVTLGYLIVSWSFDLPFSVKYSIGVFIIIRTLMDLFKKARPASKNKEDNDDQNR